MKKRGAIQGWSLQVSVGFKVQRHISEFFISRYYPVFIVSFTKLSIPRLPTVTLNHTFQIAANAESENLELAGECKYSYFFFPDTLVAS